MGQPHSWLVWARHRGSVPFQQPRKDCVPFETNRTGDGVSVHLLRLSAPGSFTALQTLISKMFCSKLPTQKSTSRSLPPGSPEPQDVALKEAGPKGLCVCPWVHFKDLKCRTYTRWRDRRGISRLGGDSLRRPLFKKKGLNEMPNLNFEGDLSLNSLRLFSLKNPIANSIPVEEILFGRNL